MLDPDRIPALPASPHAMAASFPESPSGQKPTVPGTLTRECVAPDAGWDEHNDRRPHGGLGQRTPTGYRAEFEGAPAPEGLA